MIMSEVSPVAHFGVFAGSMIISSWILAVLAFPSVLSIYMYRLEHRRKGVCCIPFCCSGGMVKPDVLVGQPLGEVADVETGNASSAAASPGARKVDEDAKAADGEEQLVLPNGEERNTSNGEDTSTKDHADVDGEVSPTYSRKLSKELAENDTSSLGRVQRLLYGIYQVLTKWPVPISSNQRWVFYPVACALSLLFTTLTIWLLYEAWNLEQPSKSFEFLPDGHMMVYKNRCFRDLFLTNGGPEEYEPIQIVWGLDADNPVKNLEEYSKFYPWRANTDPNLVYDADNYQTKKVNTPEGIRHILKVGEALDTMRCTGQRGCEGRDPSGKLFLPGSLRCAVREMLLENTTALQSNWTDGENYFERRPEWNPYCNKNGPNGTTGCWREEDYEVKRYGKGPLAALYYNIPKSELLGPDFDYRRAINPFLPNQTLASDGNFVAESFYRANTPNWQHDDRYHSVLNAAARANTDQKQAKMLRPDRPKPYLENCQNNTDHRDPEKPQCVLHPAFPVAAAQTLGYNGSVPVWNPDHWALTSNYKLYVMRIRSLILNSGATFNEVDSIYKAVDKFVSDFNAKAPASLGKAVHWSGM